MFLPILAIGWQTLKLIEVFCLEICHLVLLFFNAGGGGGSLVDLGGAAAKQAQFGKWGL